MPPACGGCQKQKALNAQRPRHLAAVSSDLPARVPHCGQCDEYRMVETPRGQKRCPDCNPKADERIQHWSETA